MAALATSACARHQPTYYSVDPQTGQPVPVVAQQPQFAQPQYPQQPDYARAQPAQQAYVQQAYPQQPCAQSSYTPPAETKRLKQGYVREPHVTVEVETYRPFFILGKVTNPGQYPYVANMTAETAIAIAGGFAPRANKSKAEITRNAPGQQIHGDVPLAFPLRPRDTIVVKERWF